MRIYRRFHPEVKKILRRGGIAFIPTDTIYGLSTPALRKNSVERLYRVRKRNPGKPFIILISSIRDIARFGVRLTPELEKFLRAHWPGPLSVVLQCDRPELKYLHRGKRSLAFRMPGERKLRRLVAASGPLVSASANPEGDRPASNYREAYAYFGDSVDVYVDTGPHRGKPSTLVSLIGRKPEIIRQGAAKIGP